MAFSFLVNACCTSFDILIAKVNTIEPPVSDHPRCEDLVVAYKNRTTGLSSEKMYGHIYFMDNDLLHAISKVPHGSMLILKFFAYSK